MKRRILWLSAFASGCSLLGLDDFAVVDCAGNNEPCRPLNERHGIDVGKASEVYQCAPEGLGCELGLKDWDNDGFLSSHVPARRGEARDCDDTRADVSPVAPEACDAVDNDCDGVVDEGLYVGAVEHVTELGRLLDEGYDFGSVAMSRAEGVLDLVTVSSDEETAARADGASLLTIDDVVSVQSDGLMISDTLEPMLDPQCPVLDEAGIEQHAPCRPRRIVSDGGSDGHLAAALDTLACDSGRIRVGEIRGDTFQVASEPASPACNAGHPMVAHDGKGCTVVGPVLGVKTLELSRMPAHDHQPEQALLVWSGTNPQGHGACGIANPQVIQKGDLTTLDRDLRTSVGVAALGLWHDPVEVVGAGRGQRPVGLTGQDAVGAPLVLGSSRGVAAPAIETVLSSAGDAHYMVAFASDQGPALHAVERFGAMANQCAAPHPQVPLRVIRSGEPWKASKPGHERADHVVLASAGDVPNACGAAGVGTRLGLAWIEGCGLDDGSIWFATVDFSPATGFCRPSTPLRVRDLVAHPVKRYQLLLAHARRGVLAGDSGGGFWLASLEGDRRVRVQRLADGDGRLVDKEPLFVGAAGVSHAGLRVSDDGAIELYAISNKSSTYDLTRARIAGACGAP